MGAGKTTVAPLLAAAWGSVWLDHDQRITRIFGASIPKLFATSEAQFRSCEQASLALLLAEPGLRAQTVVVATGGGIVLDPKNRALMARAGRVVFLDVPVDVLCHRLHAAASRGERPLLAGCAELLRARLDEILNQRRSAYEEANVVVDAAGTPQDAVRLLLAALGEG